MPRYMSEVSARSLNNNNNNQQMAGTSGYDNVESSHHHHDDVDDDDSDEGFATDRTGGGRGGNGSNKPMTTSNRCGAMCGGAHKWRLLFIVLTIILLALTGTYLGLKLTQDKNQTNEGGDNTVQNAEEGLGGCKEGDLNCGSEQQGISQEERATQIKNALNEAEVEPSLLEEPSDGSYSPQYHAYQWMVLKDSAQLQPQNEDIAQRFALATFYFSTSGGEATYEEPFGKTTWTGVNTWLTSVDECEWDGITCLQAPERINMEEGTSAEVPPPDDSDNGPPALRRGRRYRFLQGSMDDGSNESEGNVSDGEALLEAINNPFGSSSLGVVSEITLSDTGLSLGIPSELTLMPNLEILDLSNNNLSLELPNIFLQLPKLKILKLQNNQIVGSIPTSLSSNQNELEEINLGGNDDLEGQILEDVCQSSAQSEAEGGTSTTIILPDNGKVSICSCCTTDDGESSTTDTPSTEEGNEGETDSGVPEKEEETESEVPPLLPPMDGNTTTSIADSIMHVATTELSAYDPSSTFTGTGAVAVYQHPTTNELWIKLYDVTGVSSECTSELSTNVPYACGVAIMTGTECNGDDTVVGEPFYSGYDGSSEIEENSEEMTISGESENTSPITNPWIAEDGTSVNRYEIENVPSVDVTSRTYSLIKLPSPGNGLSMIENANRAFVVFGFDGTTRLLCGVLSDFVMPQLTTTSTSSSMDDSNSSDYSIMNVAEEDENNEEGGMEEEEEELDTTTISTPVSSSMDGGIQLYPGSEYDGNIAGDVTVFIKANEEIGAGSKMWINVNVTGASSNCVASSMEYAANGCGVHIHEGTNCDDADTVGGHYWNKDTMGEEVDPWDMIRYNSNADGTIEDIVVVPSSNGYGIEDNVGHVMVIHDMEGGRIGCAVLHFTDTANSGTTTIIIPPTDEAIPFLLTTQLAPPSMEGVDVDGSNLPEGEIQLTFIEGDDNSIPSMNLLFAYSSGLPPNCNPDVAQAQSSASTACQIQIHTSSECNINTLLNQQLYWNPDTLDAAGIVTTLPETWFIYTTDENGATSSDQYNLMLEGGNGYLLEDNVGRTLVVYDMEGSVAYCGVLQQMEGPEEPLLPEYPGTDEEDGPPPTVLETIELQVYPGYSNSDLDLSIPMDGFVHFQFDESGEQLLSVSYYFQDGVIDCTGTGNTQMNGCGIRIYDGTTCDDVGGHYWNKEVVGSDEDPWVNVKYVSDSKGMASGSIEVDNDLFMPNGNGYNIKENEGHVVVVHDELGKRAFCSILQVQQQKDEEVINMPPHESLDRTLEVTTFNFYPGLENVDERVPAEGLVNIVFDSETGLGMTLEYNLKNIPPNCDAGNSEYEDPNACGIHIHEGLTCDVADDVGGHYWNTELLGENDVWANVRFTSDAEGNAQGIIELYPEGNGFELSGNDGRAFVIHDESGARIFCGLLTPPTVPEFPLPEGEGPGGMQAHESLDRTLEVTTFNFYPGLENVDEQIPAEGLVNIVFDLETGLGMTLEYNLQNVPSNCQAENTNYEDPNACGIHIHEGTTCDVADDVGGHYWNTELLGENDVWANIRFTSDTEGYAQGIIELYPEGNGFPILENDGRTLVIHDETGARIFCGLLSPPLVPPVPEGEGGEGPGGGMQAHESFDRTLEVTSFNFYPGLEGTDERTLAEGYVGVVFDENDTLTMSIEYSLQNVIPNCVADRTDYNPNGCGIHIHKGTNCDVAADIGGHYWNKEVSAEDIWVDVRYNSDEEGNGVGSIELPQGNGYSLEENDGRAIVIHDETGARIFCGLLSRPDINGEPGDGDVDINVEEGGEPDNDVTKEEEGGKPDGGRVTAWDANWIVLGDSSVNSDGLVDATSSFGSVLAISGNGRRVIVGDPDGNQASVYEYMFNESTGQSSWQLVGNSLAPEADDEERFGSSVSIAEDGKAVAVSSSGIVRVYELRTVEEEGAENSTMEWQKLGNDILPSEEEASQPNLEFANTIDMSYTGKIVAVASRYTGVNVMEYREDTISGEGAWELVDRTLLPLPDDEEGNVMTHLEDGLGVASVSLSPYGDFVAIGVSAVSSSGDGTTTTQPNAAGYAQVFKLQDGAWDYHGGGTNQNSIISGFVDTYLDGDSVIIEPQSDFGSSVSISGDGMRLAVSAPSAGDEKQGLVFTYENGPLGGWDFGWKEMEGIENGVQPQLAGDATGDSYGFSVSLSNDGKMLVVGSPILDSSPTSSEREASTNIGGYARVYMWNPTNDETSPSWYHVGHQDLTSTGAEDNVNSFGYAVSISSEDGTVAIGAPGQDGSSGYVNVYVRGSELSTGTSEPPVLPQGATP